MSYVNQAVWDRVLRVLLGVLLIYLGWSDSLPGLWAAAARVLGFIPLVTGAVGWSPLYVILGIRTRKPYRSRAGSVPR